MKEFIKLEYQSLREEIRATKDRLFKLAAVALIGLPTVSAAADALEIDALVIALPSFVVATILLYLSESSGLMRCGTYIKDKIEPEDGWEHWPNHHQDRRRVDKHAVWFFITVFTVYYAIASYMATTWCWGYGANWGIAAFVLYCAIGGVLIYSLGRHYRLATQTQ